MKISIIIPVYNSKKILETLVKKITISIKKIAKDYEIILIDDFSIDKSLEKLNFLKTKYKNLRIYKNLKNIGQHLTIQKGLKISKGDLIFILDDDLQDDPKYFSEMLRIKGKTNAAVFGYMKNFSEKGLLSKFFWFFFENFTKINYKNSITTFALIDKNISSKINSKKNYTFTYAEIYKQKIEIKFFEYNRLQRLHGKSNYTYIKLFKLGMKFLYNYIFYKN